MSVIYVMERYIEAGLFAVRTARNTVVKRLVSTKYDIKNRVLLA